MPWYLAITRQRWACTNDPADACDRPFSCAQFAAENGRESCQEEEMRFQISLPPGARLSPSLTFASCPTRSSSCLHSADCSPVSFYPPSCSFLKVCLALVTPHSHNVMIILVVDFCSLFVHFLLCLSILPWAMNSRWIESNFTIISVLILILCYWWWLKEGCLPTPQNISHFFTASCWQACLCRYHVRIIVTGMCQSPAHPVKCYWHENYYKCSSQIYRCGRVWIHSFSCD